MADEFAGVTFAIWGSFLYWWGGTIYLAETIRLVRIPWVEPATASDTVDS